MTPTVSSPQFMQYSSASLDRAERAVRCAPFQLPLFATMKQQSVDLRAIAGKVGLQSGYTQQALSELAAENQLLWLIQVGVLRREVDGQGLTDSFRLTPLGHTLVEQWQQQAGRIPSASVIDRVRNSLTRWLRLPSWLQS